MRRSSGFSSFGGFASSGMRLPTSRQGPGDEDGPVLDLEWNVLPLLLQDALEVDEALRAVRHERVGDRGRLLPARGLHPLREGAAVDPRADPAALREGPGVGPPR